MLTWLVLGFIGEILFALILPRGEYYNSSSVRLKWAGLILLTPLLLIGVGLYLSVPVLAGLGFGAALSAFPTLTGYMLG